MMKIALIGCFILCSTLSAQTAQTDSMSVVSIVTSPAGADVYIDSLFAGRSPLQSVSVARGRHSIKAYYPSVFAWNAVVTRDSLDASEGGPIEKRMTVGDVVRVESDPPGGSVLRDASLLGSTPLYLRSAVSMGGDLLIQKEGYDSLQVPLSERNNGLIHVQLKAKNAFGGPDHSGDLLPSNGHLATDHWLTYASGATMITSGVVSAYLKDRANREFDLYIQTNNAANLTSTRTYDRAAVATLLISSISFGVLAYLLLSE
jgi:hypothetical protein